MDVGIIEVYDTSPVWWDQRRRCAFEGNEDNGEWMPASETSWFCTKVYMCCGLAWVGSELQLAHILTQRRFFTRTHIVATTESRMSELASLRLERLIASTPMVNLSTACSSPFRLLPASASARLDRELSSRAM